MQVSEGMLASQLCNVGSLKKTCCHFFKSLLLWKLDDGLHNCSTFLKGPQELRSFKLLLLKCHSEAWRAPSQASCGVALPWALEWSAQIDSLLALIPSAPQSSFFTSYPQQELAWYRERGSGFRVKGWAQVGSPNLYWPTVVNVHFYILYTHCLNVIENFKKETCFLRWIPVGSESWQTKAAGRFPVESYRLEFCAVIFSGKISAPFPGC